MSTYEEVFTEEAKKQIVKDGLDVPAKADMTCHGCDQVEFCDFAWDLYNTQGECLAMK